MNPPRHLAKKWLSPAFRLTGLILCVGLKAGTLFAGGSSANYSVPCDVLNAGGGHSASASYSNDGSLGGIIGIASSPTETLAAGFLAQIETLSASLPVNLSILNQPFDVKIVKGSAAFLTLSTTANESDAVQTRYTLVGTTTAGVSAAVGVGGVVPSTGILHLPLQTLTDSSLAYAVQFSRSYPDGSTATAQTRSFSVALRAWTEAAGTYTALLQDGNSSATLADGAHARGLLTATVSRTGSVSGRVVYVEAPALSGAPSAGVRAYMPATRTFTGRLLPSSADPSKLVCSVRLGTGAQTNRQAMDLKVDFLASQPTLQATVTDLISAKPEVCLSRAELCVPASGAVPPEVVGRYVLSANPALANNAYTLVQVLASGRILWTTRLTGYTGSGSGGLVAENSSKLTAPFFESRLLVGGTLLNSTVLLGGLNWTRLADSGWNAAFSRKTIQLPFRNQSRKRVHPGLLRRACFHRSGLHGFQRAKLLPLEQHGPRHTLPCVHRLPAHREGHPHGSRRCRIQLAGNRLQHRFGQSHRNSPRGCFSTDLSPAPESEPRRMERLLHCGESPTHLGWCRIIRGDAPWQWMGGNQCPNGAEHRPLGAFPSMRVQEKAPVRAAHQLAHLGRPLRSESP